jgi:hypothetical protein
MNLKEELYSQNRGKTFAESIDQAWEIYSDEDKEIQDRRIAQEFLIYAFNIRSSENLNEKLLVLMNDRIQHKAKNPEYVPGLSPKHLGLKPPDMLLQATKISEESSNLELKKLFEEKELLDVNQGDKEDDRRTGTQFFARQNRALYRVHIFQGKFCKEGELFDTKKYKAHNKKGYAAFTINVNGELSIFNHLGGKDKILHSSMNAGVPVMCAGELVIKKGELVSINTYSGHYEPSLFNIYRALEYFSSKGIDVTRTAIYTLQDFNYPDLNLTPKKSQGVNARWYKISASEFFSAVKSRLDQSLREIKHDILKYQISSVKTLLFEFKDFVTRSNLTQDRKAIASETQKLASNFLADLVDENHDVNREKAQDLKDALITLRDKNNILSQEHGKGLNSGRLHQKIEGFIKRTEDIMNLKPSLSLEQAQQLKSTF